MTDKQKFRLTLNNAFGNKVIDVTIDNNTADDFYYTGYKGYYSPPELWRELFYMGTCTVKLRCSLDSYYKYKEHHLSEVKRCGFVG